MVLLLLLGNGYETWLQHVCLLHKVGGVGGDLYKCVWGAEGDGNEGDENEEGIYGEKKGREVDVEGPCGRKWTMRVVARWVGENRRHL